jgi:hypothetical protein
LLGRQRNRLDHRGTSAMTFDARSQKGSRFAKGAS